MSVPYSTAAEVRLKLGVDPAVTDPDLDTMLTKLIGEVSEEFDRHVFGDSNIGFISARVTEYHDGGTGAVVTERWVTDANIERADVEVFEDGVALVIDDDFHLDAFPSNTIYRTTGIAEKFSAVFASGTRNIKVIYDTVYKEIPLDIERACEEETYRAYKAANTDSGDGSSIGVTSRLPDTGMVVNFVVDDWAPHTLRVLESYRKRLSFF